MGQKVHPHGFRVGIYGKNKGWRSIGMRKNLTSRNICTKISKSDGI